MSLLGRSGTTGSKPESVAAVDVTQGRALLEAAGRARGALAGPSALAGALITAAASTVGAEAGSPLHRGITEAALVGYACRLASARDPISADARAAIEGDLVRTSDGRLDHDGVIGIPATVHALRTTAGSLADRGPLVASAAGVTEGAWAACCAAAASDLRADLLDSGVPDQPILETAFLAGVIRLGFVLAIIDEIAGQAPVLRAAAQGGGGTRDGEQR
jgi:hypothetical protein